jgi:hypothetical protein
MDFWWSWVKPRAKVTTEPSLQAKLERAGAETRIQPVRKQLETGSPQRPQGLASEA